MEIESANNFEQDIILDYFHTLREEINLRIKLHSYYSISKITVCGIIFSIFIKTNAWGIISVPLIAFSLDLWIAHNIITINSIKQHIRDELENYLKILPKNKILNLYKKTYSQNTPNAILNSIDKMGHVFITAIFTLVSGWFIYSDSKFSGWYLLLAVITILFLDGAMFWFSIADKQNNQLEKLGYLAVVAIFTLVSFWFVYSASRVSGWYLLPVVMIIFCLSLLTAWYFSAKEQTLK